MNNKKNTMPVIILGLLLLNVLEVSKNKKVDKLNKICTVIASDDEYEIGISDVITNLKIVAIPPEIIPRLSIIIISAFFFNTKPLYQYIFSLST